MYFFVFVIANNGYLNPITLKKQQQNKTKNNSSRKSLSPVLECFVCFYILSYSSYSSETDIFSEVSHSSKNNILLHEKHYTCDRILTLGRTCKLIPRGGGWGGGWEGGGGVVFCFLFFVAVFQYFEKNYL